MCCKAGGHLSGAAYNPAVLIAVNALTISWSKSTKLTPNIPTMIAGEIVGAVFFALVFKFIYSPYYVTIMEEKNKASESTGYSEAKIKQEIV